MKSELFSRIKTSNLLGKNKNFVLHGGGNTSVKVNEKNIFGQFEDILYVKGSGWDLETITEDGFSPVKLKPLVSLSKLNKLTDSQMVNELQSMSEASRLRQAGYSPGLGQSGKYGPGF